jgi:hypothetical protein
MSRSAPSRPRARLLVRASQFSRSEQQDLVRAYALALPVVRELLAKRPAKIALSRRSPCHTLCGG